MCGGCGRKGRNGRNRRQANLDLEATYFDVRATQLIGVHKGFECTNQ